MGLGRFSKVALYAGAALGVALPGHAQTRSEREIHSAKNEVRSEPNIVLIVLDDVGFSDIGAFGSEIRTPNLDRLAARGLRYNRFDTKAICSATRASLLTGRNNQTVRMADLASHANKPDPSDNTQFKGDIPQNAQMIADALRRVHYATYALGKWHLTPRYEGGPGGLKFRNGSKTSWPLQRGFDHFYGFLPGWTDQYHPHLVSDNTPLPVPKKNGYDLTVDLVDHAITDVDESRKADKPFFLYLALGACHAPVQVPQSYIDRNHGRYDAGWDVIRARRFERMKKMGIIPKTTAMHPRAVGDQAWADLDSDHKRLYARYMEAYAGYLEQADEEIGRLVTHLKQTGEFDNTVIVVLSDNGAAGEGGDMGGFYTPYHDKTPFATRLAHIDQIGGPQTLPLYQRPWAMASNSPLRRYKVWPYAGGTRDPLIITWPNGISDQGAIRSQFVDVIDIAPTLLDIAGTKFSKNIDGVTQIPVAGVSIRASFASSDARAGRQVQFFELRGNRAIRDGSWKAVALHDHGTPFSADKWHLFNLAKDFGEADDVGGQYPNKVEELKKIWWEEARKYANPPLAERGVKKERKKHKGRRRGARRHISD